MNREPARSDINMQALGRVAILIELVAEHGDDDHQRADDKVENIGTVQGRILSPKMIAAPGLIRQFAIRIL